MLTLYNDLLLYNTRIVVTATLQRKVINESMKGTKKLSDAAAIILAN